MTETFSPFSKLFLGLKVLILPPLLSFSAKLLADDSLKVDENVLLIIQGGVIFSVEALTIFVTGHANEFYRNKTISRIKSQISDIKQLQSEGLEAGNSVISAQHLKKLERDLMQLTVARS